MDSKIEPVAWVDMEFLRENGDVGDCVRAATASILRIGREAVPHFVRDNAGDWKWPWRDFISGHGYEVVEVDPRMRPECMYLACGPTERSVGDGTASHMVVMNGRVLAHDPHPSRKGLTGIDRVYLLVALPAALAAAEQRGREAAAQKLDRRVTQIVNDYGDYEPDTNATNIPDDWELVCQELEDLAVAIRKGGPS